MKALIVFIILLAALFALAYFTKRRFGVLGLALCAGSLLSNSWSSTLTPWLQQQGVTLIVPPLSAVVSVILILAPAVLLLFSGPAYEKTLPRIGGAIIFALLAFVLMLNPLGLALVFDDLSLQIYSFLSLYSSYLIVIGVALALADILITRTPKRHHKA